MIYTIVYTMVYIMVYTMIYIMIYIMVYTRGVKLMCQEIVEHVGENLPFAWENVVL